jgi:hypothetical protein
MAIVTAVFFIEMASSGLAEPTSIPIVRRKAEIIRKAPSLFFDR